MRPPLTALLVLGTGSDHGGHSVGVVRLAGGSLSLSVYMSTCVVRAYLALDGVTAKTADEGEAAHVLGHGTRGAEGL